MGICKDGKLPWRLPSDLKFFKSISLTTIDPGKTNVVITENVIKCGNICTALDLLASSPYCLSIENVFVIGGGQREALNGPGCGAIHVTEIETPVAFDTFLPMVDTSVFHVWYSSFPIVGNNIQLLLMSRHDEYLCLRLVEDVLLDGTPKKTGLKLMRFNLRKTFPLLTTRVCCSKLLVYLFVILFL
ncbi:hypothetical protein NL676_038500 [Syzygium grande]|nr:hypothetical protein NL676_038500 [Syzygium grande]